MPDVERPLSQLALLRLVVRFYYGWKLASLPSGQMALTSTSRILDENANPDEPSSAGGFRWPMHFDAATPPEVPRKWLQGWRDPGELAGAADLYRAVLAAKGPRRKFASHWPRFFIVRVILTAARERYSIAVELNEDYVEARANLGCVLAELGDTELAIAAFHGALRFHPDYADVYFHLVNTLTDIGRKDEARPHWERFSSYRQKAPGRLKLANSWVSSGCVEKEAIENEIEISLVLLSITVSFLI